MLAELFQLALNNLGRARARLIMTAGGVVVGTTAVILLVALTFGLQRAAEAGIGNDAALTQIDVYPQWSDSGATLPTLNDDAVMAFWQIPGVRTVIASKNLQSGELRADDYLGYANIMGIDPRQLSYMNLQVEQGELSLQPGTVIFGAVVGQNFFDPTSETYEPVPIDVMSTPIELALFNWTTGASRELDLHINGVLLQNGSYSDYSILMPLDDVLHWNEWITGEEQDPETFVYDQVIVYATSRGTAASVSDAIRELGYYAGGIGDYLNNLNQFFVTMRLMLGAVGGIALLVAAFGVANTMMMAIMERTREIGIMKAIGATDEAILSLFLLEAGLVGLAGGVAGVLLSKVLQNLINTGIQNMPQGEGGMYFLPFDPNQIGGNLMIIPNELTVFAVVLATGVGVAAGLYPAWRAAQLPPVIALKYE